MEEMKHSLVSLDMFVEVAILVEDVVASKPGGFVYPVTRGRERLLPFFWMFRAVVPVQGSLPRISYLSPITGHLAFGRLARCFAHLERTMLGEGDWRPGKESQSSEWRVETKGKGT